MQADMLNAVINVLEVLILTQINIYSLSKNKPEWHISTAIIVENSVLTLTILYVNIDKTAEIQKIARQVLKGI